MAPTGISPVPISKTKPARRALHAGFTLLELLAVLALVGLLTGVAAVRLREPYRDARFQDALERVALTDGQVRSHARRFAREMRLVVDLSANRFYAQSENKRDSPRFRLLLPAGVRLDRVCTHQEKVNGGRITIPVTPGGQTPSYAVRLQIGDRRKQWLVFSGVTGQVSHVNEEADVQKLFQILAQSGAHPR